MICRSDAVESKSYVLIDGVKNVTKGIQDVFWRRAAAVLLVLGLVQMFVKAMVNQYFLKNTQIRSVTSLLSAYWPFFMMVYHVSLLLLARLSYVRNVRIHSLLLSLYSIPFLYLGALGFLPHYEILYRYDEFFQGVAILSGMLVSIVLVGYAIWKREQFIAALSLAPFFWSLFTLLSLPHT